MKNLLSPLGNVFLANRTIQAKVHRCKIAKKKSTLDGYCISVDVALLFFLMITLKSLDIQTSHD